MTSQYFDNWARILLEKEASMRKYLILEPISIIISWRNKIYIGHIQIIVQDYSNEIVCLNKSSKPLIDGLYRAIINIDKERLNLVADNILDLTDRQHVLRRLENKLTYMTPEQTRYIAVNMPEIIEL